MKRRPQFPHGGHVESGQHLRPVDGDVGNRIFLVEENVFEVHKKSSVLSYNLLLMTRVRLDSLNPVHERILAPRRCNFSHQSQDLILGTLIACLADKYRPKRGSKYATIHPRAVNL